MYEGCLGGCQRDVWGVSGQFDGVSLRVFSGCLGGVFVWEGVLGMSGGYLRGLSWWCLREV